MAFLTHIPLLNGRDKTVSHVCARPAMIDIRAAKVNNHHLGRCCTTLICHPSSSTSVIPKQDIPWVEISVDQIVAGQAGVSVSTSLAMIVLGTSCEKRHRFGIQLAQTHPIDEFHQD